MWIFLPAGLIMPSLAPLNEADPKLTLGYRDIQVRARLREHLEQFIEDFMVPGSDISEIEATPNMDYNFRFYTTKVEFAEALAKTVFDIDYAKFKPTAERKNPDGSPRYKRGGQYHSVLNSIWGSVLRLAPAGGFYGPKSAENPNGYSSARKGNYGGSRWDRDPVVSDLIGSDTLGDQGWWTPDYTSPSQSKAEAILEELEGLPVDQWEDELTTEDYELVLPYVDEYRKNEQRVAKARRNIGKMVNKRTRRKASRRG